MYLRTVSKVYPGQFGIVAEGRQNECKVFITKEMYVLKEGEKP